MTRRISLVLLSVFAISFAGFATRAMSASEYANQTLMHYDPQHGTQIEYFDKTGSWTYLWYPGNRATNPGQVLYVDANKGPDQLCFRYGPQIYEKLTPDSGGFECQPQSAHDGSIVERAKGDVFGLSDGSIPFVLTKERTTIGALRKKMKGGSAAAPPAADVPEGSVAVSVSSIKGSLYALATSIPKSEIPILCREIIARQDRNRLAMSEAGQLYYHGKIMGVTCVKTDYARSLELFRAANDSRNFGIFLRLIKERAAGGNQRAIAALKKVDTTPF